MTKPSFHRNHISDFRLFAKYAEDAIDQANTRLRAGHPIDIQVYTIQASIYVLSPNPFYRTYFFGLL